jgi:hypothetical protein
MEGLEHRRSDDSLLRRIRGEYREMPGLSVTREQAQRLWALDAPTCARLLKSLVDARFLRCTNGRYAPMNDNTVRRLPLRMAAAGLDDRVPPVQRLRAPG